VHEQVEPYGSMIAHAGCNGRASDAGNDASRVAVHLAEEEDLAPPPEQFGAPDVLEASNFSTSRREVVDPFATAPAAYRPRPMRFAPLR